MTTSAIFIGINTHLDATVPELSGARRDATVLWECQVILAHRAHRNWPHLFSIG